MEPTTASGPGAIGVVSSSPPAKDINDTMAAIAGQAAGQAAAIASALAGPAAAAAKAPITPGYRTSEFWLTAAVVVGGHLLHWAALIPGPWGVVAAMFSDGLAVASYNLSRGMVKK